MIFCPEIHKGIFINPRENNIEIAPCCQSKTHIVDTIDFVNDVTLRKIRKENLQDIKSDQCNACWKIEENEGYSKRHSALNFVPNCNSTPEIYSLEYNITYACNLACIMCGPHWSSRWAKELNIKDVYNRAQKTKNKIIESLDLNELRRIHFNGGEPLINNDHVNLLRKIPDLSKVKISYNTNGTVYPTDNAIKLWEKANCVRLFFSIDATGKAFDYIRWPANWQETQDNILKMKKDLPSNVMFGLNVTIGSYNLVEICDLYDWYLDTIAQNREGDASDFNWQPAQGFFPKYLDQNIKQDSLAKLKMYDQLNSLYNFIKQDLDILPNNKCMHDLSNIDLRRNTNWQQSLKIGNYYQ